MILNPNRNGRGSKSALGHALFYIGIYFMYQYSVMVTYMTALSSGALLSGSVDETALMNIAAQTSEQTVTIMLVSNLMTLLVVSFLQTIRMRKLTDEFRLHKVGFGCSAACILFGAFLNVFVSGTISRLPLPESLVESLESQYMSISENTSLALVIFSIAVVGGITEEIIFRGLVNSRLSRRWKTKTVIIVSSVLFGLAHGTPIAVVYAFVLGIVFCIMDEKHDSLIPSILTHISFNATSCLLGGVDDTLPIYLLSVAGVLICAYFVFFRHTAANNVEKQ